VTSAELGSTQADYRHAIDMSSRNGYTLKCTRM